MAFEEGFRIGHKFQPNRTMIIVDINGKKHHTSMANIGKEAWQVLLDAEKQIFLCFLEETRGAFASFQNPWLLLDNLNNLTSMFHQEQNITLHQPTVSTV
ncbi:hypothetical protein JVU11DRAFT_11769 [Chiua virens]|nr:hypothetical protein JVU11DRAFT_11769 [Chiua virens]